MNNLKLSYSSMKTLLSCEAEYFHYKVANTPVDADYEESEALGLGKAFHFVLEQTNHKTMHEEHLKQAMEENQVEVSDKPLITAMLRKYLKLHKASGLEVVKCELGIDHPDYVGYIDAIATDKYGKWWLIDLKTAARFDQNLLPRLPKDMQLNLYSYFKDSIAPILGLEKYEFGGCRYRVTTKPKLVRKSSESEEAYTDRLEAACQSVDIVIPSYLMDPAQAWSTLMEANDRARQIQAGEAPRKNYNNCISYFKPCKYFSQCHGHLFTDNTKVHVLTEEDFKNTEAL